LGAAVATLAAYGAVLVVRAADTRRIIRFDLCLPRLCISAVLLLAAAAVMTYAPAGRLLWTLAIVLILTAVNAPPLLSSLKHLLKQRRG